MKFFCSMIHFEPLLVFDITNARTRDSFSSSFIYFF